ncbi:hypothetical protein [Burkholderia cenocepacia]|uniref:hypothetical protein n=1 Tax=Burkholderia cenocepacia TaxID=95486 RepID=UPI000A790EEE|nr:hypothetical protein [Burkholderia cenocepacia]
MQKLLLSFTGTLRDVARGAISVEDLQTALFFFGCVREHAFSPGANGETDERKWFEGAEDAHKHLVPALEYAERNGRCRWHRPVSNLRLNRMEELNWLLMSSGYAPIAVDEFDLARISEAVEEANPEHLQVLH